MSSPPRTDDDNREKRKWCPLCGEWKDANVSAEERDEQNEARQNEIVFCRDCGAKLRDLQ
jgi:RNase P subunit RPR2